MSPTDFVRIRDDCGARSVLYQDDDFAAVDASLFPLNRPANVQFEWKRPGELVQNPKFVIDDLQQFDVVAGAHGDSTLASCFSVLCQYRGLFYRSVPADQGFTANFHYAGVFHFRFWWNGEWVEVLVDDRLPVVGGKLAFTHSATSNQFWPALFEKAYAKLHGSYEALQYATSASVLSELSGGVCESVPKADAQLWTPRLKQLNKATVIVAAVSSNDRSKVEQSSVAPNRHYNVLGYDKVTQFGETTWLVRVRQSPGVQRFVGPFTSAESDAWSHVDARSKAELSVASTIAIDAAWLDAAAFERCFDRLEVLYFDADTCQSELKLRDRAALHMRSVQSAWHRGVSAGGCRNHVEHFHINPQLQLSVVDNADVVVALLQHHSHAPRVIGFSVYKQAPNQMIGADFFRKNKALFHSTYSNQKQVVQRLALEAGSFVAVPTTYDSGQDGAFTMRVLSSSTVSLGAIDGQPAIVKPPIIKAPSTATDYSAMFTSFADERRTINAYELQDLLHSCLPNDYMKSSASLDVCRRVVQAFQPTQTAGRVNYEQFRDFISSLKLWQEIFGYYSRTTSGVLKAEKVRDALSDVGFNLSSETLHMLILRYMRRDGTLRFGDFVSCILHLIVAFNVFSRKDVGKIGYLKLNNTEWMKAVLRC